LRCGILSPYAAEYSSYGVPGLIFGVSSASRSKKNHPSSLARAVPSLARSGPSLARSVPSLARTSFFAHLFFCLTLFLTLLFYLHF
jgi:hypothetical protein